MLPGPLSIRAEIAPIPLTQETLCTFTCHRLCFGRSPAASVVSRTYIGLSMTSCSSCRGYMPLRPYTQQHQQALPSPGRGSARGLGVQEEAGQLPEGLAVPFGGTNSRQVCSAGMPACWSTILGGMQGPDCSLERLWPTSGMARVGVFGLLSGARHGGKDLFQRPCQGCTTAINVCTTNSSGCPSQADPSMLGGRLHPARLCPHAGISQGQQAAAAGKLAHRPPCAAGLLDSHTLTCTCNSDPL